MKKGDFRLYQKPQQIAFTKTGYEALKKKYEDLKVERPSAVEHLKKARELGDLRENGYYKASRQRLSFIDSEILRLGYLLKHGVIKRVSSIEKVMLGSTVTLQVNGKEVTYTIVGKFEADPSEGKISEVSPLGASLLGKKKGDSVVVHKRQYKVLLLK